MIRIVLAVILASVLTACGGGPGQAVVEKAIALQVRQAQAELGQLLYAEPTQPPQFTIRRVNVTRRDPLTIQAQNGYHVQGTYDLISELRDRQVTQRKNPFDIYLQWLAEPKIWRLARPQTPYEEPGDQWLITTIE